MSGRVAVGIDGSDCSSRALAFAVGEARLRGAVLEVVHAWDFPGLAGTRFAPTADLTVEEVEDAAEKVLDEALATIDSRGITVRPCLARGCPAGVLTARARGADLLVVGSRGHGNLLGLLLGGTSQRCARHSPCPLVVVP